MIDDLVREFQAPTNEVQHILYHRVDRFILYPPFWAQLKLGKLSWTKVPFGRSKITQVPGNQRGIYIFTTLPPKRGQVLCPYLLYVGSVPDSDFRTRFASYVNERSKSKPRPHISKMIECWGEHLWFCYAPLKGKPRFIKKVEDALIQAFLPPFNRIWPASISSTMRRVFA